MTSPSLRPTQPTDGADVIHVRRPRWRDIWPLIAALLLYDFALLLLSYSGVSPLDQVCTTLLWWGAIVEVQLFVAWVQLGLDKPLLLSDDAGPLLLFFGLLFFPCVLLLTLPLCILLLPTSLLCSSGLLLFRTIDLPAVEARLQFSIRGLIVVTTIAAVALGVMRWLYEQSVGQEEIMVPIALLGQLWLIPLAAALGLLRPRLFPNLFGLIAVSLVVLTLPFLSDNMFARYAVVPILQGIAMWIVTGVFLRLSGFRLYLRSTVKGLNKPLRELPDMLPFVPPDEPQPQ